MAEHGISDTAFLTCAMRAELADLSKDSHAHLWVTPGAEQLRLDFRESVDNLGERIVALRHRFFLEELKTFCSRNTGTCFVPIAAGFTIYALELPTDTPCIEVDFPDIVSAKETQLNSWFVNGKLPRRDIEFLGLDLSRADSISELVAHIDRRLENRKCFVLLEGILYYLKEAIVGQLLRSLVGVLPQGSVVGFDFWKPSMADHPVFHVLQTYFSQGQTHPADQYCFIDEAYIQAIPGIALTECMLINEVEARFTAERCFTSYANTFPDYIGLFEIC